MNEKQVINTFNELTSELITKDYLPTIYNLAFERRRAEFVNRIPRSSENVEGLQVYITYLTKVPWAWRAMSEFGYTPTGAKFDAEEGYAQMGCHASNAIVSLTELEATKQGRWQNILDKQMRAIKETFPYYVRALLWSSQNSKKAIGKVSGVSNATVTLDTSGLWYDTSSKVAHLFVPGMFVQAYSGDSKVGSPVEVTDVDFKNGTVELASDPGLSAGDLFTCSDVGGLDQPYCENCPGIYDVIDDDNVFQGIDRSAHGSKFKPVIQDATDQTLNYELLDDFFHECYNPETAHTSREIVQKYWQDNLASAVRYQPGGMFVDGHEGVQVGATKLIVDDDVPEHDIVVPDHSNWQLADRGGLENTFGTGWEKISGRPFIEYNIHWWTLLIAMNVRNFGRMHSITETSG